MITRTDILLGVLLPAAVAALVLLAGSGLRGRWAGLVLPLALAAGFVAGYAALFKWPAVPPLESTQWLFYAAAVAGALGSADAVAHPPGVRIRAARWVARAVVVLGFAVLVVWLVVRPLLVFEWEGAEAYGWIGGLAAVMTVLWAVLDGLAARGVGRSLLFSLAFVAGAAGAVAALSSSQSLGQTLGILACATGGTAVAGLIAPRLVQGRGWVLVWAVLYAGFVASATPHLFVYNGITTLNAALLLAAPPLAWAAELLPQISRRRRVATIARLALPLLPAATAVVLAVVAFSRASADYLDYGY